MKTERMLEKIKKLLAMSKDVSSPEEAMTAARLARKLMDKHQVEEFDLREATTQFGDAVYLSGMKNRLKTLSILAVSLGKYNDCTVIYSDSNILFQGFVEDTSLALDMMGYLVRTMYRISKNMNLSRTEGNSFRLGFCHGVCEQVVVLLKERETVLLPTGNSLMVCKKQLVQGQFGKTKCTKTSVTYKDQGAFETGKSVGSKMDLSKQGKLT